MVAGLDPVAAGLAVSLARPGRNVTGVCFLNEDLITKRVQLLKEVLPGIQRIGILYGPEGGRAEAWLRTTEGAARSLSLQTQVVEFRTIDDLKGAFATLAASKVEAIIPVPSSFLSSHPESVTKLAALHRKPAMYSSPRYSDAGGLLSYHADIQGGVARAAEYVDRILKGSRASDLAIQQSTLVELVVNLKSAKELGLVIPPSVLLRADRVIQ
jgi:putative ABC transport system substrate-binding protein